MYLVKSPSLLRLIYPSLLWRMDTNDKVIYLTFDDGPIPDVTDFVLKTLEAYHAKATFFCIGENIHKHPTLYARVVEAGHSIGNHTYNHLRGWDTDTEAYVSNAEKCQNLTNTDLFRPPYGRIKFSQIRGLREHLNPNLRIVMWDVISGDWDSGIGPEKCLKNVIKHTRPGSIVVFHDSIKAAANMRYTLPKFLAHFTNLGYSFAAL